MKTIIFVLILITCSMKGYSQNFIDSTFTYGGVNYKVLSDNTSSIMTIYNVANPENISAKVLSRTRMINYQQLKVSIVGVFKSILTSTQVVGLQSERPIIINLFVDATSKINIVYLFQSDYNTCLTQANIYNIEIALKNIIVQFQDGLPPEAGQLGSIGIPKRMWR